MSQINSPTIDENQMKLFKEASEQWWIPKGPLMSLHTMKDIAIPYIQESLAKASLIKNEFSNTSTPLKGLRILDAGCGGGIIVEALAALGGTVVGVDVNPYLIQVAKDHACLSSSITKNITYVLTSIEDHAKENIAKYDVVISNCVLEHVNEPQLYLNGCTQCLRPGGLIYLSSVGKTIMGWLFGKVLPEYVFGLLPRGCHEYEKFVLVRDTEKMLLNSGCKTMESRGLLYNTEDFSYFFIDDTSGFYTITSIKQ